MADISNKIPSSTTQENETLPELFQVQLTSFGVFPAVDPNVLDTSTNVDSWDGGETWNAETRQWDPPAPWDPAQPRILFPMNADETWILVQNNRAVSVFQNPLPNVPKVNIDDLNREWDFARPDDDLSKMCNFAVPENPDK